MPVLRKSPNLDNPPRAISPKMANLMREAWWLIFVGLALYLTLILQTYDPSDPAWSRSGMESSIIHNAGGMFGAWAADILLYVFGVSAYWFVGLALFGIWWGYHHLNHQGLFSDKPTLVVALIGFVLLIVASAGLEALRFYNLSVALPLQPGGVIGMIVANAFSKAFGFTGATLALLLSIAVGASLFIGLSWIKLAEKVGAGLEYAFLWVKQAIQNIRDRRLGSLNTDKREQFVAEERKRVEDHEPLKIETPMLEIIKSPRQQKEKQSPLFHDLPDSALPPLRLLDEADADVEILSAETLEFTSRLIERKLMDFGVEVKVIAAYPGPVITRYEIEPAVGVKGSQITNLVRDLARALSVISIRLVETIPGKSCMGLEIPNPKRQIVRLVEILSSQAYANMASPLTIALGKDISGQPVVADLAKMPHVLVAGTTGSGKSVALNAMILSLLYKADISELRMILIDPKMLELSVYGDIPHLLSPVVTDMKQASIALNWCVAEMERRYQLMSLMGVRNLAGYNQKVRDAVRAGTPLHNPLTPPGEVGEALEEMPSIVVVIDELADLMMVVGKKVEELIARLTQKARASGMHLILATQRPSVDVITGLIKANIPTRVAFQVSSKVDSRTILDQMGAEALLGQGDMLYLPPGTAYPQRVHGAFVADHEVHKVVQHLKSAGEPQYVEGILEGEASFNGETSGESDPENDPFYDEAVGIVLNTRRASISLIQRHLRIGYNRAARLIEQMERSGLVSAMQPNGNREVLAPASKTS